MFEQILLKSLIYDGTFFNKIFNLLKTDYFKEIGNKESFNLLKKYYSKYHERPSETALITMIKDVPNSELRKSITESLKKVVSTELNSNTEFMLDETVKFIKDSIYYKSLEIGSEGLMNKDESKIKKAQSLVEEMNKVQIDSDLGLDFDDIQSQIDYYSKREFGIKTQHMSINRRLGTGFLPGTLNVLLASQGVGKSLLMCDFISGMIQNNKNVLMVSLEMSENEMLKRIHANVFDIGVNTFTDLSKNQTELDNLERPATTKEDIVNAYEKFKASGKAGRFFVKEFPAGSFSASMLQSLVDKFKVEKDVKFDVIFIDYLGIMKSDLVSASAGLYSYVKSITEEVRAFAVRNQTVVISASQLNRSSVNKTDGVDNSAVSDSYGTSATADLMIFILQNEEMKEKGEILLKFTKNRYTGITDSFIMNIDYQKMRFEDIDGDFKSIEQKENSDKLVKTFKSEIIKHDNEVVKSHKDDKKLSVDDIMSFIQNS